MESKKCMARIRVLIISLSFTTKYEVESTLSPKIIVSRTGES